MGEGGRIREKAGLFTTTKTIRRVKSSFSFKPGL